MTLDDKQAIKKVAARRGGMALLAKKSGVKPETVRLIVSGITRSPRLDTWTPLVKAAREVLDAAEAVAPRKGRRASKPTRKTAKNLGGGSRRTREPRASVAPASPGRDGSETPATTSGSAPSPATATRQPMTVRGHQAPASAGEDQP